MVSSCEIKVTFIVYDFSLIVSYVTHHVEGTLLPVGRVRLVIICNTGGNFSFGPQSLHKQRNESLWFSFCYNYHLYSKLELCFLYTDKENNSIGGDLFCRLSSTPFLRLKKVLMNIKYIL